MTFPYGKHKIFNSDIKSVIKVLQSNSLTQGPLPLKFESEIAKYCKSKYSVSANSATSCLHISCLALGLKKGDFLWTVPNTFVASANCGIYCGANVDFVDIDKYSLNIDIEKLENKLIIAKKNKKLPKIVVSVHFAGQPTIQEKIYALSKKYKFKIIEDASHSLGSKRNTSITGNCKFSDITVFSFHPVKMITTIEGGVATTNSKTIYKLLKLYSSHGIEKDKKNFVHKKYPSNYYEMQGLGYNYRMNDVQASLGLSQLQKIDKFLIKRNAIAALYKKNLKDLPIRFQKIDKNNYSSYHLFTINFLEKNHIKNKFKLIKKLRNNKINVGVHYIPVHLHPYYCKKGFKNNMFPVSENHFKSTISLPIYYDLNVGQINYISDLLVHLLKKV